MKLILPVLICLLFIISCSKKSATGPADSNGKTIAAPGIVDSKAAYETKALYLNLKKMAGKGVMFGHQDDTAYGVGWQFENDRSDVKSVCGCYPAVYGWDIGDIGQPQNLDGVNFELMQFLIKQAYKRGGINTISMHIDNPVSGGDAWDIARAVGEIIPGGSKHEQYKKLLDLAAAFFGALKSDNGDAIPVIFRPYHEHTGNWFWWGEGSCTKDEFVALWRFTVQYLRDEKNIHNLLYAYSPSGYIDDQHYLQRYPGDEYVDILGIDIYELWQAGQKNTFTQQLSRLGQLAEARDKIAALTEVGLEKVTINNWWTEYLLKPIEADSSSKKITYLLVWRNANEGHFFAPYPGQASVPNFLIFYQDSYTLFENDIAKIYSY